MILGFDEVLKLKKEIADRFGNYLHFHDACGGQSFNLERPQPEAKAYLIEYFRSRGAVAVFQEDGMHFYVK